MFIRDLKLNELIALAMIDKEVNLTPWNLEHYRGSYDNTKHKIIGIFNGKKSSATLDIDLKSTKNKCFGDKKALGFREELLGGIVYSEIIDQVEILQLVVKKEFQNQGLASLLLKHLFDSLCDLNYYSVFLEVMIDNKAAFNLYQKHGFNQISIRKNYYLVNNKRVDAILMARDILSSS